MLSSAQRHDLEDAYEIAEERHIALARTNIRAFVSYVMRDEQTGSEVDLSEMHYAWHYLADQYDRLIVWSFPESGKTINLSIARTLFRLGQNPQLLFGICSASDEMAIKIAGLIGRYIESSEELHRVFPKLVPDPESSWNTSSMTVLRPHKAKDPSINVISVGSNFQGSRLNEIIMDDILNFDNTRTAHMREQMEEWYLTSVPGRLNPVNGRAIFLVNAFHPDDLAHRLAKNPRWKAFKFPIVKRDGRTPQWPERWGESAIQARIAELTPAEANRQLMLQVRSDETSRFKEAWIEAAKRRGEGKDPAYALRAVPAGCRVDIGIDLGVKKEEKNAKTVFFVLLTHPNGDEELLWVEGARMLSPQILEKIEEMERRFSGALFVCENNQAQDYIVQLVQHGTSIQIVGFTTGKQKVDPVFGIEGMTAGLAANPCKWIIPSRGGRCHPEVQAWIDGLLAYTPEAHTSDYVMAGYFAHAAKLLKLEKPKPKTGVVNLNLRKW